jgi:nucleotide-binding universal stress UspA family protein
MQDFIMNHLIDAGAAAVLVAIPLIIMWLKGVAKKTPTEIDDKLLDFLEKVARRAGAQAGKESAETVVEEAKPRLERIAEVAGTQAAITVQDASK